MQQSPKREGPYLLKRVGRKAQKEKARKKVQVKRAVKSACGLPQYVPRQIDIDYRAFYEY